MALPDPSILSEIAVQLGNTVTSSVGGKPKVRIGPPSEAETGNAAKDQLINLFLYRFEPSGFYPEATTGDPLHMRIHCLVTAYGAQESEPNPGGNQTIVGAGEVDLRLLGAVAQHFHEDPVRDIVFRRTNPVTIQDEEIRTSLQIVLKSLSSEEINQIWSTQGSSSYRSSLAYELALAPITPWTPTHPAQPVDSARIEMLAPMSAPPAAGGGASSGNGPGLNRITDAEMAKIVQGKTTPPELPPELGFAGATPPHRRVVHVWPATGGGFDTEAATVDLGYTPHSGLSGHKLFVYRRTGGTWTLSKPRDITVPPSGTATITFAVVPQPGEWVFYVDAAETVDGIASTYRSAAVTLTQPELAQDPAGGGSP